MLLTTADYAVTVAMLVIPLAIGFFYAWKDSKKVNRDEYLLGGRRMGLLPVTLSMFVTFQSAISLIGIPSDVYRYGPMVLAFYIGTMLAWLFGSFTMVPLMYPLQLTSVFDYLEMRYNSRALRLFCTVVGMLQTFAYMVVAMVAPGLALQAAAGIPFWMSVAVVGSIGTVYTAIGGIKSVIWTDVFQTVILLGGLVILGVRGVLLVGGVDKVWAVAEKGGRTSMTTFSPDPRTRHTWWGMTIGSMFLMLTYVFNQSSVQRVRAMKSLRAARTAALLNLPCLFAFATLLGAIAIIGYAFFYVIQCDPLEGGLISNMNQVSLYFMLLVFQDFPGLSGFYMAAVFSGALSTLSSGINALAANTVEDILAGWLKGTSERRVIIIAKVLVFFYGFSIVGVAYLAKAMEGPVTQITSIVSGAFGSVVVAIFLMGCLVPWTNKYGACVGGLLTLALNWWIALGNFMHGRKSKPLPSPPTDQCFFLTNASSPYNSSSIEVAMNTTSSRTPVSTLSSTTTTEDPYKYGFFLYDISYEWYAFIGVVVCSICILISSKLVSGQVKARTNARLIVPFLRNYWGLGDVIATSENKLDPLHLDS